MPVLIPIAAEVIATTIISTAIGAAVEAITGNTSKPSNSLSPSASPADNLAVAADPGGYQLGVFGHLRVGGRVRAYGPSGSKTYYAIQVAGDKIQSLNAIYANNVLLAVDASGFVRTMPYGNVTGSSMRIKFYDGTQTTADPWLTAAFPGWSADAVGKLQAYAVIEIDKTASSSAYASAYDSGAPDFTFDVCGFKCYDPRDGAQTLGTPSTYKYTTNAALIDANYRIHALGRALPTDRIDWTSVAAAATICDQTVALASGGTEPRYTAGLYWTTDERHEDVCARIGAAYGGGMFLAGTKYVARVGAYTSPSAAVTPRDYLGEGLRFTDATAIAGTCNGVRGKFTSPLNNYEQVDFPSYQNATALSQDGGEIWADLDLRCVTSPSQAQRLAKIAYYKTRFAAPAAVSLRPAFLDVVSDDVITITDDLAGLSAQPYRVVADSMSADHIVSLQLEVDDSTWYTWTTADEKSFSVGGSLLGDPGLLPPSCILWDANATAGQVNIQVQVYPSPSASCDQIEVKVQRTGGALTTFTVDNSAQNINTAIVLNSGQSTIIVFTLTAVNTITGARSESLQLGAVTTYLTLDGVTVGTSTTIVQGSVETPTIKSQTPGSVTLRIYASPNTRVANLFVYETTTPVFSASVLTATLSNADQDLTVTGSTATVKYYWVRPATSTTTSKPSNPVLVVF